MLATGDLKYRAIERDVYKRQLGAHGKAIHRRGRSVIRQRSDDGKARPAVGAVDKGEVIASVGGVEQFAQAVVKMCIRDRSS